MDPMTLMAIMGGGGLLKSELIDRPKEDRQRKLAAITQMYSPWTGMEAQKIQEADPFGTALKYGGTGASMGMAMQQAKTEKMMADKLAAGDVKPNYNVNLNVGGDRGSKPDFGSKGFNSWADQYNFDYPPVVY